MVGCIPSSRWPAPKDSTSLEVFVLKYHVRTLSLLSPPFLFLIFYLIVLFILLNFLCIYIMLPIQCCYGIPQCGNKCISVSCVCPWPPFLLVACFVQFQCASFLSYYILSHIIFMILFSLRNLFVFQRQKWVDLQGRGGSEELGVEGGETAIRIYHGRKKESVFNKRKEINSPQKCNCRQMWQQFSVCFNWVYIHSSLLIPVNYHDTVREKLIDLYLIVFFILPSNLYIFILKYIF